MNEEYKDKNNDYRETSYQGFNIKYSQQFVEDIKEIYDIDFLTNVKQSIDIFLKDGISIIDTIRFEPSISIREMIEIVNNNVRYTIGRLDGWKK